MKKSIYQFTKFAILLMVFAACNGQSASKDSCTTTGGIVKDVLEESTNVIGEGSFTWNGKTYHANVTPASQNYYYSLQIEQKDGDSSILMEVAFTDEQAARTPGDYKGSDYLPSINEIERSKQRNEVFVNVPLEGNGHDKETNYSGKVEKSGSGYVFTCDKVKLNSGALTNVKVTYK